MMVSNNYGSSGRLQIQHDGPPGSARPAPTGACRGWSQCAALRSGPVMTRRSCIRRSSCRRRMPRIPGTPGTLHDSAGPRSADGRPRHDQGQPCNRQFIGTGITFRALFICIQYYRPEAFGYRGRPPNAGGSPERTLSLPLSCADRRGRRRRRRGLRGDASVPQYFAPLLRCQM